MPGLAGVVIRVRNLAPPVVRRTLDRLIAAERGPIAWAKERMLVRGDIPGAPEPRTERPVRLLIAPLNYAGQGHAWARSASSDRVEAGNLAVEVAGSLRAAADWTVSAEVFTASRAWRAAQRAAVQRFTHVAIESFASPFGRGTGRIVLEDIAWLRRHGISVALLCHGTDIRQPARHLRTHAFSPFRTMSRAALTAAEGSAAANLAVVRSFDGPVFVSTPDLLDDVPDATWLPVVVDPSRWRSERPVDGGRPIVLHVPSSGPVKGTDDVDRVASALDAEGVVEYRRLERIPVEQMPAQVGGADIVVDQLLLGSYGVAAVEALAAGRVVVGNVSDAVRAYVRRETGLEVPIVQADPETLEGVLRRLADDAELRTLTAAAGPAFVDHVHAGGRTAQALQDFLGSSA